MSRPSLALNLKKPTVAVGLNAKGNGDDAVALRTGAPLPHEKKGDDSPIFYFYEEFWKSLTQEEKEFLRELHMMKSRSFGRGTLTTGEILNLWFPR